MTETQLNKYVGTVLDEYVREGDEVLIFSVLKIDEDWGTCIDATAEFMEDPPALAIAAIENIIQEFHIDRDALAEMLRTTEKPFDESGHWEVKAAKREPRPQLLSWVEDIVEKIKGGGE